MLPPAAVNPATWPKFSCSTWPAPAGLVAVEKAVLGAVGVRLPLAVVTLSTDS